MTQKIILLFGGESEERLVSVASAQAMAEAIGDVKLWFWHKNGKVFVIDYNFLRDHKNPFTSELNPTHAPIYDTINDAINSPIADEHIFLLGVHGGTGENGYLQNLLEKARRPFTGANAIASERAFDKIATKAWLKNHDVKMAPQIIIEVNDHESHSKLTHFFTTHGALVVKPVCGGSSIGCTFVKSVDDITLAIEAIAHFPQQRFLVEKMIMGTEISVGVIEDDNGARGLCGTEIVLEHARDFDYEGKYLGVGTKEITPPRLSPELIAQAQHLAVTAHVALELDGYSRTDMILADDGFYYLETNTLPGMTKKSIVPQQLAHCGMTMRELLVMLIARGQKRAR